MTKLLDRKNDVVFQKLFGMKNHKNILISFLNSILNLTGDNLELLKSWTKIAARAESLEEFHEKITWFWI